MFKLRRLLAGLILVAVLALGIVIWRHLQQQGPLEVLEALPAKIDLSLDKLHYTQNEEGRRSWTLDAEKAEYRRAEGLAVLDAVRLILYDAGRFGEVELTAEHGSLDQKNRQVEVWGNVVVVSAKGEQLFTDRLHYDGRQQLLKSSDPVRMIGPRLEMTGIGLQVDLVHGHLLLEKDIWMLLLPEEKKDHGDE